MTNNQLPHDLRPIPMPWNEVVAEEREIIKNDPPDPPGARLTPAQIVARYPKQWVVVVKMDYYDNEYEPDFRSAVVVGVHPDLGEVLRMAREITRNYRAAGSYHTNHLRTVSLRP